MKTLSNPVDVWSRVGLGPYDGTSHLKESYWNLPSMTDRTRPYDTTEDPE